MKKKTKDSISKYLKLIVVVSSLLGMASIILEYGFKVSRNDAEVLHFVSIGVISVFLIYYLTQFLLSETKTSYIQNHRVESIIVLLIFLEIALSVFDLSLIEKIGEAFKLKDLTYLYIVVAQIFIVIGIALGALRYNSKLLQSKIHPSRLFIFSFLFTILAGTLLLMLPAATVSGKISFVDALFTSTSAVCVTGLITVDTATYYTTFGQIVIMMLFQIGGLGLMTFTTFFAVFLSGGMGIKERILLHDLMDEENIGAITKILSYLLFITFIIEAIGAAILFFSSYQSFSNINHALFISIFHSISAFCNAGFSIFTLNLMDPLVKNNYVFTTTISILIILGGLGFPTIISLLKTNKLNSKLSKLSFKVPLQTRMVLSSTIILIIVGTLLFYFLELNGSLNKLGFFEKLHASFFQSVSSRTAGFNTIDFSIIGVPTAILFYFLMFVGASPGGTGGGIKTTTFVLLIYGSLAILRNQKEVDFHNRSIPTDIILKALVKTGLSTLFITLGIFLLTITEGAGLVNIAFESFSAFGTVGLSMGLTSTLSVIGKIVIVVLMFVGRVGPIAFLYTFMTKSSETYYELPKENISIL